MRQRGSWITAPAGLRWERMARSAWRCSTTRTTPWWVDFISTRLEKYVITVVAYSGIQAIWVQIAGSMPTRCVVAGLTSIIRMTRWSGGLVGVVLFGLD